MNETDDYNKQIELVDLALDTRIALTELFNKSKKVAKKISKRTAKAQYDLIMASFQNSESVIPIRSISNSIATPDTVAKYKSVISNSQAKKVQLFIR